MALQYGRSHSSPPTITRSKTSDGRNPNPQKEEQTKTGGENWRQMGIQQCNLATFQPQYAPKASSLNMRILESSRGPFVRLDQPAQSFVADDVIEQERLVFSRWIGSCLRVECVHQQLLESDLATHKATNVMNQSALCLLERSPASWSFVTVGKVNS